MNAEEKYLLEQGLERQYGTIEISFDGMVNHLKSYAESLAKERERDTSLKFAEYIDQKYQLMIDGSIEENFDTFLAEKRKEGK